MRALWISEWERLWKKKTIWLIFVAIPLVVGLSSLYYLKQNSKLSPTSPEYTVFDNFAIMGLAEQLITLFNLIVIWIVVSMFTEEYHTGQLRFILLRAYSFSQIYLAKWLVIALTLFLYVFLYFLFTYAIGFFLFENTEQIPLFYHTQSVSSWEAWVYNLSYYLIAYLTLLAFASVMTCIAIFCKTPTAAIGTGVGFLIGSILLPKFLTSLPLGWQFLSIPHLQWLGIVTMLSNSSIFLINLMILSGYLFLFLIISFWKFTHQDQFA